MRDVIIIGAGGHAKVVADSCRSAGRHIRGFLDPGFTAGSKVLDLPVLGDDDWLEDPQHRESVEVAVGIGSPAVHRSATIRAIRLGADFAVVLHSSAIISPYAQIDRGAFVNAGAVVNAVVRIGAHSVVNTACSIDHDCVLGEFVHVAPGATLCGGVTCRDQVIIGAGAIILPGRTIGLGATVGAGAVVTEDVSDGTTVRGVPAKAISR